MKQIFLPATLILLLACSQKDNSTPKTESPVDGAGNTASKKHFKAAILNGMKGDSLFFDISADGKKLQNLTFKGYWRCSGKLERETAAGPTGSFDIVNGKVEGHISEPPNGGSTAWRFDLNTTINGNSAEGTFRMNINNLGCDSYVLKFKASAL